MIPEFQPAVVDRLNSISFNGTVQVHPEVPRDPQFPYVTIDRLQKEVLQRTDTVTVFEVDLRVKLVYRYDAGEVHDEELKKNTEKIEDALAQTLSVSGYEVSETHNQRNTDYRTQHEDDRTYKSGVVRFEYLLQ